MGRTAETRSAQSERVRRCVGVAPRPLYIRVMGERTNGSRASTPGTDELLDVLRRLLSSEADVQFAYLFGSFAKGRTRGASDVDVAVHLEGHDSPSARFDRGLVLEGRLERALERTVQVSVLNDAPLELRFNVLAHGRLATSADDAARCRFYVDTGRRYYDMAPARDLFRRRRRERIERGRSVVEEATVRRLLETVEQRLSRLERASGVSLDDYLDDDDLQDVVERNFEVGIQACIDLGLHVLADLPRPLPETYRGVFVELARQKIIPGELAGRLERMAGFRNVLAHGYSDVMAERVHATLEELDDIRTFVAHVTRYLES